MKNGLIFLSLLFVVLGSCKETENEQDGIDAYLAESGLSYTTIQEGLYHIQHKEGTGDNPASDAIINVSYEGSYLDGEVFDARVGNYDISNWVEGLQIGIPLMKRGGESTFIIHSDLGYGRSGYLTIPGNTPLIFKIELIDF